MLPAKDIQLETADATYYLFKADILSGMVTYSTDRRMAVNLVTIPRERALEIIALNKNGQKPIHLEADGPAEPARLTDLVEQESLTRFDKSKKKKNKNKKRRQNQQRGAMNGPNN